MSPLCSMLDFSVTWVAFNLVSFLGGGGRGGSVGFFLIKKSQCIFQAYMGSAE